MSSMKKIVSYALTILVVVLEPSTCLFATELPQFQSQTSQPVTSPQEVSLRNSSGLPEAFENSDPNNPLSKPEEQLASNSALPVPEGWVRAASNENYAFSQKVEPTGGYFKYTLQVMDLRTGQAKDIVSGMLPYGTFTDKYDVAAGENGVVVFEFVSYEHNQGWTKSVYLAKISDPDQKIKIDGALDSYQVFSNDTGIILKTPAETRIIDLRNLSDLTPQVTKAFLDYYGGKLPKGATFEILESNNFPESDILVKVYFHKKGGLNTPVYEDIYIDVFTENPYHEGPYVKFAESYNTQGNKLEFKQYNETLNGVELSIREQYEYRHDGKLKEYNLRMVSEGVVLRTWHIEYYSNGVEKISQQMFRREGKIYYLETKRRENGNIIHDYSRISDLDGKVESERIVYYYKNSMIKRDYFFRYDSASGQLLEKRVSYYSKTGALIKIITKTYSTKP